MGATKEFKYFVVDLTMRLRVVQTNTVNLVVFTTDNVNFSKSNFATTDRGGGDDGILCAITFGDGLRRWKL